MTRILTPPARGFDRRPASRRANRLRRRWDERAAGWHCHVFESPGFAEVRASVIRLAGPRPTDQVVDLGSGSGFLTLPLARRVRHVLAVDVAPVMLAGLADEANRSGRLPVSTQVADLAELRLPAASLDLIVSNYALHHLSDSDKQALLERACRWLRPGGRIVIADVMLGRGRTRQDQRIIAAKVGALARKGPGGLWRIAKNAVRLGLRVGSERPVSATTWVTMLQAAGFTHVTHEHVVAEAGVVAARGASHRRSVQRASSTCRG